MNKEKLSGILIFLGVSQFLLFMIVSEALYPGYSVSKNYISDLGVGSTAYIFNTSIIIMGLLLIISSFFLKNKILQVFLILSGIGAAGVGIFPETSPYHLHTLMSLVVFLFSSLSSYVAFTYRSNKNYLWPIMGSIGLISLILYILKIYGPIDYGGMERLIVYPNLIWALGFSGFLMSSK
ncbi:putative membrane protein [Caldisphaera lagunensis DSM 15908]|uniref:Putative membrane protein n=1 Tax=Caldisphaera lagunensis (strain DSM 15908 / JCM 11604 / ANMR 0165 / IC-154) TaxID=1056495 RepID=L0AAZ5_CALLD|nr:DUF998 domain-containing protein [Caldisphaera lagunensis]AFZ70584.1 putative membrane protein [Caldisphaera lagunensis DSM 15908]